MISTVRRTRIRGKQVRVDALKLANAKRRGCGNDTEAIDRAVTLVVPEEEIDQTLHRIGGKGGVKKVFR